MHNLNLYNYYDKSLADINKEYLETLKSRTAKKTNKRWGLKIAIASLSSIVIGFGVAFYAGVFEEKVVVAPPPPPPPPDLRTDEEKQGYMQIQVFEFSETPTETIQEQADIALEKAKQEEEKKKKELEAKKALEIKQAAIKQKAEPKKEVKPAPVPIYNIVIDGVDEAQYNKIKNVALQNNIKLETSNVYANTYVVWQVFEKNVNGSMTILDIKVDHKEDFLTKEDAENYAKSFNIDAVIKQSSITEKLYNINMLCSSLEEAKNIARQTNITDKTIKIVRQK